MGLARNRVHFGETAERWLRLRNRRQESSEYQEAWWGQQCGMCTYWIPLGGRWNDWGVCTNGESPLDRHAVNEHDGCPFFLSAGDWGTNIPGEFED